jgi:hypothetical protein
MENDDPPKRFFSSEVRQLRHEFFRDRLLPHVGEWFAQYPKLQSSAFLVAQYYADNAWDEVHTRLVVSELTTPDLNAALTRTASDKEDHQNLPSYGDLNYRFRYSSPETFATNIELRDELAIPLFAAFCKEGSTQDFDDVDSFSVCATLRRQAEGTVEIDVAPMLRPWLDGVALQSEFDDAANRGTADPSHDQFAPRWMQEQRDAPTQRHSSKDLW